jgi:hypothetical protein
MTEAWKWSVTVPVEHLAVTYNELRDAALAYLTRKGIVLDAISDVTAAQYVQSLLRRATESRRIGKRDDAIDCAMRAGVAACLLIERGRDESVRGAFHAIECRRGNERNVHTITQAYERASASAAALVSTAPESASQGAVAQHVLGHVCLCLYWDDVNIVERLRSATYNPRGDAAA